MNAGRTTRKGFTLIEMLAAMALMVAAASCLYSSLYTAFRARRSAEAALNPTLTAWRAIELAKQDLSRCRRRAFWRGAFSGLMHWTARDTTATA